MNALRFKGFWFTLVVVVPCVAWGNTLTLTTTGIGSITIPAGYEWTDVTVQCWGGGGVGGASIGYVGLQCSGGGGGGAYSAKTYATPLVAGTYSYCVGAGGGCGGYDVGQSTIWNYAGADDIIAGGGGGGYYLGYAVGGSGGTVGAGTGYSGGDGGYGGSGINACGGGGGGSGGPSGPGGQGGDGTPLAGYGLGGTGYGPGGDSGNLSADRNGVSGGFPGGGGGGGAFGYFGGSGANGEIIITYTPVNIPEPSTLTLLVVGALALLGYAWRRRIHRVLNIMAER